MKREAKVILSSAGIKIGQAFESLSADQVAAIHTEAAATYRSKHGAPMPVDSATYIRKRYDLLQQRARSLRSPRLVGQ
jgi:hypothetical protein